MITCVCNLIWFDYDTSLNYEPPSLQTYVGEIIVAVNPFKIIKGIYDPEMMRKYSNIGDRASHPPHIFATADAAFSAMVQNPPGVKANQVRVATSI